MKKQVWGLGLALAVFACQGKDKKNKGEGETYQITGGPSITAQQFLSLRSLENCSEADAYLQSNMRRILKDSLEQQRQSFLYWRTNPGYGWDNAASPVAESAGDAGTTSNAPKDYSKTNTQVAGVDEPDMVKSNGTHIFSISGENIEIVQSWPAESMKVVAKINTDGLPRSLFLTDDKKLIVVSNPLPQDLPGYPGPFMPPWYVYRSYDYNVVHLSIYDVADAAKPALVRDFHFRGDYLNMRRQGNLIRLVTADRYLSLPEGTVSYVDWYGGNGRTISVEEFGQRLAAAEAKNEEILKNLTFQSWINSRKNYGYQWQGTTDDPLAQASDCSKVYVSESMGNTGLTTITSLDIGSGALDQSALISPADTLYASEGSLYVAFNQRYWWWGWGVDVGSKTFIHKFKYDDPSSLNLSYEGSGMLDGYILNQFSLDEYEGRLRVAVTDDHVPTGDPAAGARWNFQTVNRVAVLEAQDGKLNVVGQTEDLAPGERIYSSRFDGAKGYVVTFRQTDPLYTLDLSDPKAPKVSGELKVNGFSSYIQKIDDNHLLTVGQEANDQGRVQGLKISVFDVSNPSQPTEKFKYVVSDAVYSWSEAQYDHHAFTYFASRGLLGIPVGGYRPTSGNWWNSYFSELRVFHIDLEKGISATGSLAMNDLYQGERTDWGYWWDGAQVRRSVFADDYVYAISNAGIKAVNGSDFANPVGFVGFYP